MSDARAPDAPPADGWTSVPLGDVPAAGSRHRGRRSSVLLTDGLVVAGTADGEVRAFDRETLDRQWTAECEGKPVSLAALGGDADGASVVVGERGPTGAVTALDAADGDVRWRYGTAADVGGPQKETRFFYPFVADIATDGDRAYVASRRYERDGNDSGPDRVFESVVYAFERDGSVAWTFETDASPIALDRRDDRLAVAFNRCLDDHQHGLVVLDAGSGDPLVDWDPGTEGQRRCGDVSLLADGVAVTSHGDYRGYVLDRDGGVRWRVDLATPVDEGGETVYAYPNHVHATEAGVVFVTGNTYPEEGRETDARHPSEHTAFGYSPGGDRRWTDDVGGFVTDLGADGDLVAAPGAQNFRERDPDDHALRAYDVNEGRRELLDAGGVVTAAALDGGVAAAIEEPVEYHDDGERRGAHRLHVGRI
ncbi:PQQ-binding-like beta-propeller repeat protein [Halostella sp. JP-L12]|uniref:outer membrane protein assembly factor BamB family protein n=1 Tax=Halostella TaxID=1843185 RepID=UPI000EF7A5A0|nr:MULTISPECIES: PQQ-binding-like beta-propeller repeat protein [Halostella]NHN47821.1 PQQ-binding-like beta-propeller repeat protein [Halostella sp. JP-L12]